MQLAIRELSTYNILVELLREGQDVAHDAHARPPLISGWKRQIPLTVFQRIRRRYSPGQLFLAGSIVAELVLCLALYAKFGHVSPSVLAFSSIGIAMSFLLSRRPKRRLERKDVLLDDMGEPHACVEIEYLAGNLALGIDRGVVYITEGWLNYQGERTQFSLKPGEAEGEEVPADAAMPDYVLTGTEQPFKIRFFNIRGAKGPSVCDVRMVCGSWKEMDARVLGVSVLPPLLPDEDYMLDLSFGIALSHAAGFAGLGLAVGAIRLLDLHPGVASGVFGCAISLLGLLIFGMACGKGIALWLHRSKLSRLFEQAGV